MTFDGLWTANAVHTQILALLTGLGMSPAEADRLIQEAVAEGC